MVTTVSVILVFFVILPAFVILLAFISFIVVLLIKKLIAMKKGLPSKELSQQLLYDTLSLACIIMMGVSWVFNVGWIRLFLTIPILLHAILFFIANHYCCNDHKTSRKMNMQRNLIYITYLFANMLLPDYNPAAGSFRAIFGLFHHPILIGIFYVASSTLFVANIALVVIQIATTSNIKHQLKSF